MDGANRPYNVAVVVPELDELVEIATRLKLPVDSRSLLESAEVRALFSSELESCSAGFRPFELIERFILVDEPFTVESGLLTPTRKVRRWRILAHWAEEIGALYVD